MTQRTMSFTRLAREGAELEEPVLVTQAGVIRGTYRPVGYVDTLDAGFVSEARAREMVGLPTGEAIKRAFEARNPVILPSRPDVAVELRVGDEIAHEVVPGVQHDDGLVSIRPALPGQDRFNSKPFTPAPRTRSGK